RAVGWRGRAHANDHLPLSRRADVLAFEGAADAFRGALAEAGVQLSDLDLLETHDCFTVAELLQYEAFGIAEPGKGAAALADGRTERDGDLPVNPSGGLKSKGHPIGATGVSQHVMAALQLTGEAGDMQVPGAQLAAVFNMGGVAVANYCSVLERVPCAPRPRPRHPPHRNPTPTRDRRPGRSGPSTSPTCSPRPPGACPHGTPWCADRNASVGMSSTRRPPLSPRNCAGAASAAGTRCWSTPPTTSS